MHKKSNISNNTRKSIIEEVDEIEEYDNIEDDRFLKHSVSLGINEFRKITGSLNNENIEDDSIKKKDNSKNTKIYSINLEN